MLLWLRSALRLHRERPPLLVASCATRAAVKTMSIISTFYCCLKVLCTLSGIVLTFSRLSFPHLCTGADSRFTFGFSCFSYIPGSVLPVRPVPRVSPEVGPVVALYFCLQFGEIVKNAGGRWDKQSEKWKAVDEIALISLIETRAGFLLVATSK